MSMKGRLVRGVGELYKAREDEDKEGKERGKHRITGEEKGSKRQR